MLGDIVIQHCPAIQQSASTCWIQYTFFTNISISKTFKVVCMKICKSFYCCRLIQKFDSPTYQFWKVDDFLSFPVMVWTINSSNRIKWIWANCSDQKQPDHKHSRKFRSELLLIWTSQNKVKVTTVMSFISFISLFKIIILAFKECVQNIS